MGKTKIKTIDDSIPVDESKKPAKKDELVDKLKAELDIANEVEETAKLSESAGAKQIRSERPGRASGTSTTNEPAHSRSKKYQAVSKDLDRTKFYPLDSAIDMVKKMSYAKFNGKTSGSLEAHINTAQTGVRGLVSLPYASGKKLRILAFGKGAESSGADIFGTDSTIDEITTGKIDFDLILTTPEWMPKLVKVAKVLGPKGIMPNPKNGTITSGEAGLKAAVESFQAGKVEYKTEAKAPVMHIALGKLNQPNEELATNVRSLLSAIGRTKIKKVTLAPTMGPSIKLDLNTI